MTILYILIALLAAVAVTGFFRAYASSLSSRNLKADNQRLSDQCDALVGELQQEKETRATLLRNSDERITQMRLRAEKAEVRLEELQRRRQAEIEENEKTQEKLRTEFRHIASELIEQRSAQLRELNKESVDTLLKPFRQNMVDFRERIDAIYSDENRQRGALHNELKNLMELNRRITEETSNLTRALKGDSKVQGDWGETLLNTILENSNLVKGLHYTVQENFRNEQGSNVRPDVVLRLPGEKRIVIDSKVSLTAYVAHCECEDEKERAACLQQHLISVKNHIRELASKSYQDLIGISNDFVIMFIPNEPAFITAVQTDSALWTEAYNRKVIISSPTNLFALLKLVDDLWQRDSQSRNAMDIAKKGADLYDKFVGFVESMLTIGKNLDRASESYTTAINQLSRGRGNLVRMAENFRELGLNPKKKMPENLLSADEMPEPSQTISSDPAGPSDSVDLDEPC